jgi:pimeloyl-ACP methyl ester carboxylesterase
MPASSNAARSGRGEAKAASARRLAAAALRIAALSALIILLAGIGVAMFQNHLLYFPQRASVTEMTSAGLSPWPTAPEFRGLLAEPAVPARATAIIFHGNAGHAGHRQFYADVLTRLGVRVILAEYPAYGARAGELGEPSLVADAEQTIALAHARYPGPLLIIGESLGAGVAAAASVRHRQAISGLLLFTPWDRLEQVASFHYPLLPVKWLLRDRYDSVSHLASFGRPVLIAVAGDDRIVPARFGQALYESLAAPQAPVGHRRRRPQRLVRPARRRLVAAGARLPDRRDALSRASAPAARAATLLAEPAAATPHQHSLLAGFAGSIFWLDSLARFFSPPSAHAASASPA